jgi:hypothetical protein
MFGFVRGLFGQSSSIQATRPQGNGPELLDAIAPSSPRFQPAHHGSDSPDIDGHPPTPPILSIRKSRLVWFSTLDIPETYVSIKGTPESKGDKHELHCEIFADETDPPDNIGQLSDIFVNSRANKIFVRVEGSNNEAVWREWESTEDTLFHPLAPDFRLVGKTSHGAKWGTRNAFYLANSRRTTCTISDCVQATIGYHGTLSAAGAAKKGKAKRKAAKTESGSEEERPERKKARRDRVSKEEIEKREWEENSRPKKRKGKVRHSNEETSQEEEEKAKEKEKEKRKKAKKVKKIRGPEEVEVAEEMLKPKPNKARYSDGEEEEEEEEESFNMVKMARKTQEPEEVEERQKQKQKRKQKQKQKQTKKRPWDSDEEEVEERPKQKQTKKKAWDSDEEREEEEAKIVAEKEEPRMPKKATSQVPEEEEEIGPNLMPEGPNEETQEKPSESNATDPNTLKPAEPLARFIVHSPGRATLSPIPVPGPSSGAAQATPSPVIVLVPSSDATQESRLSTPTPGPSAPDIGQATRPPTPGPSSVSLATTPLIQRLRLNPKAWLTRAGIEWPFSAKTIRWVSGIFTVLPWMKTRGGGNPVRQISLMFLHMLTHPLTA